MFYPLFKLKLWNLEVRVQENQIFYVDLIEELIGINEKIITLSRTQGELWREVAAAGFLLRARISMGISVSLSHTFIFDCTYTSGDFVWYAHIVL